MKFDQQQFETAWQNFSPHHDKLKLSAYFFDNIPSTNQKLWELIAAGEAFTAGSDRLHTKHRKRSISSIASLEILAATL